jgi:hypothetical protein
VEPAFALSDEEMKALMIEVVNKVYTFITHMEDLVACGIPPAGSARARQSSLQIALQRAAERNGEKPK